MVPMCDAWSHGTNLRLFSPCEIAAAGGVPFEMAKASHGRRLSSPWMPDTFRDLFRPAWAPPRSTGKGAPASPPDERLLGELYSRATRRMTTPSLSWPTLHHLTQRDTCGELEQRLPQLRFLRVGDVGERTMLRREVAQSSTTLTRHLLVHLSGGGESLIGGDGVVMTTNASALLDLSQGCCRPEGASCWQTSEQSSAAEWTSWHSCASTGGHAFAAKMISSVVARPSGGKQRVVRRYDWVYLSHHSHAVTYFHAVGEALPRLLWGFELLCSQPSIRIFMVGWINAKLLEVLGLANRLVTWDSSEVIMARTLTIPPQAMMGKAWGAAEKAVSRRSLEMLEVSAAATAAATAAAAGGSKTDGGGRQDRPYILVVRRDSSAKNARAVLNHDQWTRALQSVFPKHAVREFAPLPQPFADVINLWRGAALVVGPHGAGMTNAYFADPRASVVEVMRFGQKGRVYAVRWPRRPDGSCVRVGRGSEGIRRRVWLPTCVMTRRIDSRRLGAGTQGELATSWRVWGWKLGWKGSIR